ncbi:formate--tetrahydrofolate ligase 1 [Striga asiatica]|uniref:Formate--tetrahydrofolate ligase 1 n=1 Tax=Striga asiatica TaxID=4170 RepID=A0A5A7PW18_STRAF|nr:formate--tetrahydrofolate ligase 1 [Striga asiatica]
MASRETCRTELRSAVRHRSDRGLCSTGSGADNGDRARPLKAPSIAHSILAGGAPPSAAAIKLSGPEEYDYDMMDGDFHLLASLTLTAGSIEGMLINIITSVLDGFALEFGPQVKTRLDQAEIDLTH